jgi:NAD(P) transhydrogenase subunit alpha
MSALVDAMVLTAGGGASVDQLIQNLTFFVLAAFLGYSVITKIPANLHTPLMSGANAITGITLVGAVVVAGEGQTQVATVLGFVAVVMATINVVGGYLVTHRMLKDFSRGGGGNR